MRAVSASFVATLLAALALSAQATPSQQQQIEIDHCTIMSKAVLEFAKARDQGLAKMDAYNTVTNGQPYRAGSMVDQTLQWAYDHADENAEAASAHFYGHCSLDALEALTPQTEEQAKASAAVCQQQNAARPDETRICMDEKISALIAAANAPPLAPTSATAVAPRPAQSRAQTLSSSKLQLAAAAPVKAPESAPEPAPRAPAPAPQAPAPQVAQAPLPAPAPLQMPIPAPVRAKPAVPAAASTAAVAKAPAPAPLEPTVVAVAQPASGSAPPQLTPAPAPLPSAATAPVKAPEPAQVAVAQPPVPAPVLPPPLPAPAAISTPKPAAAPVVVAQAPVPVAPPPLPTPAQAPQAAPEVTAPAPQPVVAQTQAPAAAPAPAPVAAKADRPAPGTAQAESAYVVKAPAPAPAGAAEPRLAVLSPPSLPGIGKLSLGMAMYDAEHTFHSFGEEDQDEFGAETQTFLISDGHGYVVLLTQKDKPDTLYGIEYHGGADADTAPTIMGLRLGQGALAVLTHVGEPSRRERLPNSENTRWYYDGRNYSFDISSGGDLVAVRLYGYEGLQSPDSDDSAAPAPVTP